MKNAARQDRLLLVGNPTPLVHAGPCIEALRDEVDAVDPADVTCPACIARRSRVKPLTFAQQRRADYSDEAFTRPTPPAASK